MRTTLLALALAFASSSAGAQGKPFDWSALKKIWRARIEAVRRSGQAPLLDVESCYRDLTLDPDPFARAMDAYGVALIAMSPELDHRDREDGYRSWSDSVHRLVATRPEHFIPVPTADLQTVRDWGGDPYAFLEKLFAQALRDGYPMLGEFSFGEYPSPLRIASGVEDPPGTLIGVPVDGPVAERIFAFSQEHGVAFQMHLEIEDVLLDGLERMLDRYPKATVVWCHVGRVRDPSKTRRYGPEYLRGLLQRHPNLYFDLAATEFYQYYPPTDEFCSTLWDQATHRLKPEWERLIADYPWHFLMAFDLGANRTSYLYSPARQGRVLLGALPPEVRDIVGYKAAWKLLFHEDPGASSR